MLDQPAVSPPDAAPRSRPVTAPAEAASLRDISPHQWKSGIAAWLGWLFDGLDMHLYTLVAVAFVAELLRTDKSDPAVSYYSSWIQAAFLFGWAFGGGFFGIVGDRLGRTRTLMLTVLTYALFTGLSFFAQTWWQLMIFRFVAALGIGGEWAVGASLLSETWPKRWRPWMAAILQTGVNLGIVVASIAVILMANLPPRSVFLVGVLPAFLVLWIRRAVPETEEWHAARTDAGHESPRFLDLFRGEVRRTSILTLLVCACSLTAHWAFTFWSLQHLRHLPEVQSWTDGERSSLVSQVMTIVMVCSIAGNFFAAFLAKVMGYRRAIALMCPAYFVSLYFIYHVPRTHQELMYLLILPGICQGVFALFTMYLPPLFPTLLRTSGAGFCYNFGRIAAALGTVFFGLFNKVGDYSMAIIWSASLFLPAAALVCLMSEPPDEALQEWSPESVEPEV